jgi:ketosteroid isomerase-like protein
MDARERLLITQELHAQLMEYWHDVDTNWGRNAGDYYTEDAVFEGPEATYRGKAKIQQFYRWREQRGKRVAVHAVSNFRVQFESDTRATSTWYLLLYAADGEPILPTHPPITISLVTDKLERQPDGRWLYSGRKFETWFQGGPPPTNPKLDDD